MPDALILESIDTRAFPPGSTLLRLSEPLVDHLGDSHDYIVIIRQGPEYGPDQTCCWVHPCNVIYLCDPDTGEPSDTIEMVCPTPGSMMPLRRLAYGSIRQAITELGYSPVYEDEVA